MKTQETQRKNTRYKPALALSLCVRLANGETLQEICRSPGMPSRETVYKSWMKKYPDFAQQFTLVRMLQDTKAQQPNQSTTNQKAPPSSLAQLDIAKLAQEVIELADTANAHNLEAFRKTKLQMDARRWYVNWAMLNHWRQRQAGAVAAPQSQPLLPQDLLPEHFNDVYSTLLEQHLQENTKENTQTEKIHKPDDDTP